MLLVSSFGEFNQLSTPQKEAGIDGENFVTLIFVINALKSMESDPSIATIEKLNALQPDLTSDFEFTEFFLAETVSFAYVKLFFDSVSIIESNRVAIITSVILAMPEGFKILQLLEEITDDFVIYHKSIFDYLITFVDEADQLVVALAVSEIEITEIDIGTLEAALTSQASVENTHKLSN
jgi:hypothetical protein